MGRSWPEREVWNLNDNDDFGGMEAHKHNGRPRQCLKDIQQDSSWCHGHANALSPGGSSAGTDSGWGLTVDDEPGLPAVCCGNEARPAGEGQELVLVPTVRLRPAPWIFETPVVVLIKKCRHHFTYQAWHWTKCSSAG